MKNFFQKIWAFLSLLFTDVDVWIEKNALPSIEVAKNIRDFVNSPIAIALTAIIPGTWDDTLRDQFSKNLSLAINKLVPFYEIHNEQDEYRKIYLFTEWLKGLTPAMRAAAYQKLAAKMALLNAGDDSKKHSVDLLIQTVYSKLKEKITEDELEDKDAAMNMHIEPLPPLQETH